MNQRPLPVTVIACVYILAGAVGFAYHAPELRTGNVFRYDALWIELLRIAAVVSGVFMLRARDWARWLALAWMAFHVVVGALHGLTQFAVHALFLVLIAWFLFRPNATRYFRPGKLA